ncbi:MAG TPA: DUF885 domain-containing protein [Candidatus Limnocylindrales bacterium]|nr:DUF885 domain-containing protein [Candidatus Limnocylindrales bacterium]
MPPSRPDQSIARPGPLDEQFAALVRERFLRLMERNPVSATHLGIHDHDHRLADAGRDAVDQELAEARSDLAAYEAIDPAGLSPESRIDREAAVLAAKRQIFAIEEQRLWERRGTAMDEIGDGIFLLFVRDFAPLPERLVSITARLEQAPRVISETQTRLGERPVRLWNELELRSAEEMASLFDEVLAAARPVWPEDSTEWRRLSGAVERANAAIDSYQGWLREVIARGGDDVALGAERYDELIALRAFDGLTTDEILEIGYQQLAANRNARREMARRIDPDAPEEEVLERVKSDHPASFAEALAGYRDVMFRARQHVIDHDLATIPPGERLEVMATPDYLRNVMPFAAYFDPARFDPDPVGIYIVTPSVDDDPGAMREHNWASISNTSIHEAYPGHHLQLSAANTHPSLARVLIDAPEFVEGWGMYCEQMMREQGFDDAPPFLLSMHTDAIWRACRIILDVRLHRGEVTPAEAIDFLVEQTRFERPNATAEVNRYTYTPTYQLSYLLGKVMLLRLREDEQRRLGRDFSLRAFHDSLLYAGSLPISFHRRLLAEGIVARPAGGGGPAERLAAR